MLRLILLGILAGSDNLQVAAAISMTPITRGRRTMLAAMFCLCEITTPLLGLLIAEQLRARLAWFDRVAPLVVVLCGIAIVWLALRETDTAPLVNSRWTTFGLPLSLSVDNLLIGVSLGTLGYAPAVAALTIGATSALLCLIGVVAGTRIRRWMPERAEVAGGVYLVTVAAMMWLRS